MDKAKDQTSVLVRDSTSTSTVISYCAVISEMQG